MYILGLSPSWGTSRICPAWSPSEHQLTPALSPIWGPHPKPRRTEEVVYSPYDSCSHFTQRLLPPNFLATYTYYSTLYTNTYYTSHSSKQFFFSIKLFIHILIYNTDHPRAEDRNGGLFASATPPLATRIEFICLFLFKTITLSNA